MSTLTVSNISNGSVSTSSANVIQGSAKAWVNFNGSGGTIRASYNVSSITVTTTGYYTVNLTNALSDTNYVVNANTSVISGSSFAEAVNIYGDGYSLISPTTSAFVIRTLSAGFGGYVNPNYVFVSVFR
jgi:hypothetical protein